MQPSSSCPTWNGKLSSRSPEACLCHCYLVVQHGFAPVCSAPRLGQAHLTEGAAGGVRHSPGDSQRCNASTLQRVCRSSDRTM